MKKLLYILGFLMFATAALQPVVTLGQEQFSQEEQDLPFSTARIFSKIFENDNPASDWGTSFGTTDEEDVGQDLYLMVYSKTEIQPQRDATRETAQKYGLNEGELIRVINGNYNVISDRKPGLRQEELQEKVVEIQQEFARRREISQLKAQVKASVEVSEIFANGDLDDSGFDLINDLDIIEELLFLHTHPIDIGSSYTSTSGPGLAQVGQAGGTQATETGPEGTSRPSTVGQPLTGTGETAGGATGAAAGAGAPGAGGAAAGAAGGAAGLNPNFCFADDALSDALDEFEDNAQTDPNYRDNSADQDDTQVSGGQETDDSGDGGDGDIGTTRQALSGADEDFFPAQPDPDLSNLQPAPADNWLKDQLCNDVFCLQVNFVTAPATSSYANSDNCIACHVEKINDILKTVITHSLSPTKAPGNLGESAECKKAMATAFGNVSMNFYAIAMPVKTPPNDDLIFGTTVEEEWQEFCRRVEFFPFDACKTPEEKTAEIEEQGYELPPLIEDRAAKQAISQTPDDATQADVTTRIDNTITGYALESFQEAQALEQQRQTDEASIAYHPLRIEIQQMNYYFQNIQDIVHSLHEPVDSFPGKQACTDIKNKKECE